MAKQERAERTRGALVRAAAAEFDRHGYEGTSLGRICRAAEVSMGALTFHFSTKAELADAVRAQGLAAVAALRDRVAQARTPALRSVIDLTVGLTRLLAEDVFVRSAARLARERQDDGAADWTDAWLPRVRELLARACEEGQLHPAADPAGVTALVAYLMAGAELRVSTRESGAGAESGRAEAEMERVWQLLLLGVSGRAG